MKQEKISTNKILASTSLVFGILSLFSFEKTVDTQRNTVITNLVKKNYFMSKVDKYIYKYDVNKLRCYTKAERETKVKNRKGIEWI